MHIVYMGSGRSSIACTKVSELMRRRRNWGLTRNVPQTFSNEKKIGNRERYFLGFLRAPKLENTTTKEELKCASRGTSQTDDRSNAGVSERQPWRRWSSQQYCQSTEREETRARRRRDINSWDFRRPPSSS